MFYKHVGITDRNSLHDHSDEEVKLTSVKDSVKILGICKKINKTLTQQQKVVVLVRLFELVAADKQFTDQRMAIINTVGEVFNVNPEKSSITEGAQDVLKDSENTLRWLKENLGLEPTA